MAAVLLKRSYDLDEKVVHMQRDAMYEIASDSEQRSAIDACMSIKAPKPPPTIPKVFLANDCAFNCAYCGCRRGNDGKTCYRSTPRELAELAFAQAKAGKHGIFITSAVLESPDYTQEQIIETLRILRQELCYGGYLHAKVMPGADPLLIRKSGLLADRLSVNIEVARSEGYRMVAKNKNKENILGPMNAISTMIRTAKEERRSFATTQTTQLMAGSTGEDDRTILRLADAMYRKYRLSRVYYTSFQYQHKAKGYDELPLTSTPRWRMHRLYQADRLLQLYDFSVEDIAPEGASNLVHDLDPKAAWALRNIHLFPVEINAADYESLLRVPGIGVTYAKRIVEARRYGPVSFDTLVALGVSLKRSRHFITCRGRFTGISNEEALRRTLSGGVFAEQTLLSI